MTGHAQAAQDADAERDFAAESLAEGDWVGYAIEYSASAHRPAPEPEAQVLTGHVIDVLRSLPAESVSVCVTSPPYWSLRKYDAEDVVWGGDPDCPHTLEAAPMQGEGYGGSRRWQHDGVSRQETPEAWVTERVYQDAPIRDGNEGVGFHDAETTKAQRWRDTSTCSRCGAWRGQYGLEPTPDLYVEHTLMVLREIRRVLRKDGVVFWNVGDSYHTGFKGPENRRAGKNSLPSAANFEGLPPNRIHQDGLKPKDLVLMPERVALAAQADGWWVRSRIIWHKPNAMPESVRDRPTDDHEHIWMLTKSARYYWGQEAVREASTSPEQEAHNQRYAKPYAAYDDRAEWSGQPGNVNNVGIHSRPGPGGRNLRTVWSFPTAQTPEAHFATFPEELPRRCIEAACPREICTACGKARVRLVERGFTSHDGETESLYEEGSKGHRISLLRQAARANGREYANETQTIGFSDCGCGAPFTPGIVLDPFAGLATTGVVARRLGRRFIGIELSERYAEMARAKLALWWRKADIVEPERDEAQQALPLQGGTP